jgi:hypothetical protein
VTRLILLARKPLGEKSVAENVLKHGTGGLNIDNTRIAGPSWKWGTQTDIKGGGYGSKRPTDGDVFAKNVEGGQKGRWPSNLILQHKEGCRKVGAVETKGTLRKPTGKAIYSTGGTSVQWNPNSVRDTTVRGFGTETIDQWDCVEGCPVKDLGEQSGVSQSAIRKGDGTNLDPSKESWRFTRQTGGHTDQGTAARYFKQVQGKKP